MDTFPEQKGQITLALLTSLILIEIELSKCTIVSSFSIFSDLMLSIFVINFSKDIRSLPSFLICG